MGYEIVYHYHDRLPDGKWNTEERHQIHKKVGAATEEVELNKLAVIILGQLAKRDKLVVDVDVYEYTKKQINFKESADGSGIILKNKKFSTNNLAGNLIEQTVESTVEDVVKDVVEESHTKPPSNVVWMVFEPEVQQIVAIRQRGYALTPGKKYPVLNKKPQPGGIGELITTKDDGGKIISISDEYFIANSEIRLEYDQIIRAKERQTSKEPRLSYQNVRNPAPEVDMSVPNLRPHLPREVR